MTLAVGNVVDGVVTGVTKFGAFVQLPENKSGLVHISEISGNYVEKVSDFLSKGQKVRVKVLSLDDKGKISLSIRQAKPKTNRPAEINWLKEESQENLSFEDKLSKFLKDSNEKIEFVKSRESHRSGSKNRRQ